MPVGLAVTKSEIDARAGDTARAFQKLFGDVATLKGFCDQTPDKDLVDLGYTNQEVADLKTAVNDMAQHGRIFVGDEALAAPKDFRVFMRRLWGVGSF